MTVTDVAAVAGTVTSPEVYRGAEFQVRVQPRSSWRSPSMNRFLDAAIEAIVHAARTGDSGQAATAKSSSSPWRTACVSHRRTREEAIGG